MRYLTVKNWHEHQHYKKRNPPWIKLHRAITEDYAFAALKDKTKAHLMLIWTIASGNDGRVPHDAAFVAKRINASEAVDLEAMIQAGFLIPDDSPQDQEPAPKGNGSHKLMHDTSEIIERLPLNTGEEFEVRQSYVDELKRLYPSVDVPQTLREARGWCIANPQKCKTQSGIKRFINGWMTREQNRG